MATVLRVLGFANNTPCPIADEYVMSFDVDARGGRGYGVFTPDLDKALRFDNFIDALKFYRQVSTVKPRRADGKPNRPLTSCHISFEPVKDEQAPSPAQPG
jgi:hypothetical protein